MHEESIGNNHHESVHFEDSIPFRHRIVIYTKGDNCIGNLKNAVSTATLRFFWEERVDVLSQYMV